MIVAVGSFRLALQYHDQFRAAISRLIENTRTERGCLQYTVSIDVEDAELIHYCEVWQDGDCLKDHMESACMKRFYEDVGQLGLSSPHVLQYEAKQMA
jgi:quinol monooxygenase YgiN